MASAPSVVPGVMAYSFKITAKDELHSTCSLGIQVPDKGGRALFGKSLAQFNALTRSGQYDASEVVEGVPVAAKMIITFKPDDESVFVCAFDMCVLRNDEI